MYMLKIVHTHIYECEGMYVHTLFLTNHDPSLT